MPQSDKDQLFLNNKKPKVYKDPECTFKVFIFNKIAQNKLKIQIDG